MGKVSVQRDFTGGGGSRRQRPAAPTGRKRARGPGIIFHLRQRCEVTRFHMERETCQHGGGFAGRESAGALAFGGTSSEPRAPSCSARCAVPPPCSWKRPRPFSLLVGTACVGRGDVREGKKERGADWLQPSQCHTPVTLGESGPLPRLWVVRWSCEQEGGGGTGSPRPSGH